MSFIPMQGPSGKKQNLEAKRKASESSREIDANSVQLKELEQKVTKLTVLAEALWEILKKQESLENSDLLQKVEETKELIEQRSKVKTVCRSCNQQVPIHKANCYYCGEKITVTEDKSAFNF